MSKLPSSDGLAAGVLLILGILLGLVCLIISAHGAK